VSAAVAIIPAHNEAPRIAPVIKAALSASRVGRVLVVDDGSTDGTAQVARQAGAEVLSLSPNRGKGQAMLAGVRATHEPIVLFLDADLTGLTPGHVERLIVPVASGSCVMAVGLRDYGPIWGELQEALPRIGGERAALRSVLNRVPPTFWSGFRIEAGINATAYKMGRVCDVTLYGVSMVSKWYKSNPATGLLNGVRMLRDVMVAMGEAQRL
jgi:glycosyltransferase involved in cell wall biosynthesis